MEGSRRKPVFGNSDMSVMVSPRSIEIEAVLGDPGCLEAEFG
jgi:hypothetical protein